MNISNVKHTTGGYIVNTQFFIPHDEANKDYQDIAVWIANGGIVAPEFTNAELLQNAKNEKVAAIKALRTFNLNKPTPQTITYSGNLSNRSFDIEVEKHLPLFQAIIASLQRKIDSGVQNPTRAFSDSTGERLELSIADYKSLANHLDERDEQQYTQAQLKTDAVNTLTTVAAVNAFDITQIL
jgi:hypothetical protein